jgi:DNA-binding transcriptional MerR regulator
MVVRTTDACEPAVAAPALPAEDRAARGALQIGDVAERTGLSLRTVRHYEEVGLLPPARRSPGGFRLYGDAAVQRLLVIKQMKPLEFTLEQMRELLDHLDELAAGPAPERRRQIEDHLRRYQELVTQRVDTLRERLTGAQALQNSLDDLLL